MKKHQVTLAGVIVGVLTIATIGWCAVSLAAPQARLTASVECNRGYSVITADGPGDTLTYTAKSGPLAGQAFRVTNTPTEHKWVFATDVADINPANSYDVIYHLQASDNGQPVAATDISTPASCSAKQVTIDR